MAALSVVESVELRVDLKEASMVEMMVVAKVALAGSLAGDNFWRVMFKDGDDCDFTNLELVEILELKTTSTEQTSTIDLDMVGSLMAPPACEGRHGASSEFSGTVAACAELEEELARGMLLRWRSDSNPRS